jgi:CDGSH iron-sulfur domain-containing protein 3
MTKNAPYTMWLKKGTYYWCSCGKSEIEPFCDSSHGGTGKKPFEFVINAYEEVSLCGCGKTRRPPYCDGSHDR